MPGWTRIALSKPVGYGENSKIGQMDLQRIWLPTDTYALFGLSRSQASGPEGCVC